MYEVSYYPRTSNSRSRLAEQSRRTFPLSPVPCILFVRHALLYCLVRIMSSFGILYLVRTHARTFAVIADEAWASRSGHTSPQMLTLEARQLRASRAVHRRLPPASGAENTLSWASRSVHPAQHIFLCLRELLCAVATTSLEIFVAFTCAVVCCFLYFCFVPQVSVEEGEDRAKAEGIMFIETSAKGGYNIKASLELPCTLREW